MDITWNFIDNNEETTVKLIYNVYLGTMKLFINDMQTLNLKGFNKNLKLAFVHNSKNYSIKLIPDNYGYTGTILTTEGNYIYPIAKTIEYSKTPLWIVPLIIANLAVPVLAFEALSPWILAFIASALTINLSKRSSISFLSRILISLCSTVVLWIILILFIRHK